MSTNRITCTYDVVAGSRREPRGVLVSGLALREAQAARADYTLGRGCARYIKRVTWISM